MLYAVFYFTCVIAVARTSNTVLTRSGMSGHLCLFPDCRGKAFTFSLLSVVLSVDLSFTAFIMLSIVSFKVTVALLIFLCLFLLVGS